MPIQIAEVTLGSFYTTETHQLRKITGIKKFDDGSERIEYLAKSDKIPNREFHPGSTLKNPPTRATFANDCDKRLNDAEVASRRANGIILSKE